MILNLYFLMPYLIKFDLWADVFIAVKYFYFFKKQVLSMHTKYLKGEFHVGGSRLFLVSSDRTGGNGHKLKYRKVHLNIRKSCFTLRLEWSLLLRRYLKPAWMQSCKPCSGHGLADLQKSPTFLIFLLSE